MRKSKKVILFPKKYSVSEIKNLSLERLKFHYRSVSATISYISCYYGSRCCELCHDYVGTDWEKDVGQFLVEWKDYLNFLKTVKTY